MDVNPNPSREPDKQCDDTSAEKVLSSGIQLRTSARVSKKLRHDQEVQNAVATINEKKSPVEEVKEEKKRKPSPWSPEEKAAFFEALNEFGKNFEAIENAMILRAKKRGDTMTKNRGQARNFYYGTWVKLSKYIKFPDNVNRATQELYTLINFGELRKKVGKITEKNWQKLSELIYCGTTQVRVRGKTWRVKTPVCPALRRINHLQESGDEVKLPTRVEVLVVGKSQRASLRVQSLAHNPRVRTTLPLHTPLQLLLGYLEERWTPPNLRNLIGCESTERLMIGPSSEVSIVKPAYRCGQIVSSASVSLLALQKRNCTPNINHLISQVGKTKSVLKWQREEAGEDEFVNADILEPGVPQTTGEGKDTKENKEEFENRIRQGWNKDTSSMVHIGQLYMMFGSNGTLKMEYWWEGGNKDSGEQNVSMALSKLISLAKLYNTKAKVECPCGHVCRGKQEGGGLQGVARTAKSGAASKAGRVAVVQVGAAGRPQTQAAARPALQPLEQPSTRGRDQPSAIVSSSLTQLEEVELGGGAVCSSFKQPLLPAPPRPSPNTSDTLKALQQFRPKYCNRRGRARTKSQVVVQRMLLPKASAPPVLVTLQVVPQGATQVAGEFIKLSEEESRSRESSSLLSLATPTQHFTLPTTTPSTTFSGLLGSEGVEGTPPTSPTSILREGDSHWLNSELADFSFSSFLGNLESPMKNSSIQASEDTRLSTDVESHFHNLMTESSLDYTAKFADLAAKVAASSPTTKGQLS